MTDRRGQAGSDADRATAAREPAHDLLIDLHEEEAPVAAPEALDQSMRLLAKLLVKAATAPREAPQGDHQMPVDVSVRSKVRLDRR